MRSSVVSVLSLLFLASNCTALVFEDVARARVIETGQLTKGMEDDKQEILFDRTTDSIHTEWDAMLESTRSLEEDAKEVDAEEFENTHLELIKREIDQLNACHNLIHHIFGAPPPAIVKDSLNEPQIAWKQDRIPDHKGEMKLFREQYKTSIQVILENVQISMRDPYIPTGLHHLQIACNNCIIQTMQFIRRFELAPHDLIEQIQSWLRSMPGLKWFVRATREIARTQTKYDNEFSWSPYFEVHLKYHFQLFCFKQLFKDFSKKQQDWILFHYLMIRPDVKVRKVVFKDKPIEEDKWSASMLLFIQFARKLKGFLLKRLEDGDQDQQEYTTEHFFLDIKDDLVQFRKLIIEPTDNIVADDYILDHYVVITSSVLEFLHSRFGLDWVNSELFAGDPVNKLELAKKRDILNFRFNHKIWKDMLLDYSHYLAEFYKNRGQGDYIKIHVLEEKRKQFYWQMCKENLIVYKKVKVRQFKDPEWKEKIQSNKYYQNFIDELDSESSNLGNLFKKVKSLTGTKVLPSNNQID
ncbi:hypothetical protein MJO28_003142 [Puccinia striiformis f. sp. tritici]|uniref:Uncharacterized protein n=3 Tax=Puccinia striiformis TaxID=27350 RepID=A0A0L0VHJ1_9BASI|nr:hypothetical protein Pst134EB_006026 [Puccinia striiformis f. sp. tritici]KAI9631325.1 hypothetical protein KEM48_014467 [Puccinia striiformis f. sp. tritici PST-130]KNE98691.1 hypothetical protein PSTG_08059 [Puccinia striiformis f. sp. tritici PST-78]POW15109.1 hypothetical protein PSTT_02379 [Puccinia striiformis]KAI7959351.1 hypothetical protein MJO28_003142 [Puccinia striiformis f. sp. tritici]